MMSASSCISSSEGHVGAHGRVGEEERRAQACMGVGCTGGVGVAERRVEVGGWAWGGQLHGARCGQQWQRDASRHAATQMQRGSRHA